MRTLFKALVKAIGMGVIVVIGFLLMIAFAICMSSIGTNPLFLLGGLLFLFLTVVYIFTLEQVFDARETKKLREMHGLR